MCMACTAIAVLPSSAHRHSLRMMVQSPRLQDVENRRPQEQYALSAKQPDPWTDSVHLLEFQNVASCSSPERATSTPLAPLESPVRHQALQGSGACSFCTRQQPLTMSASTLRPCNG